jgi:V8-like Glu-specific endopeptidase
MNAMFRRALSLVNVLGGKRRPLPRRSRHADVRTLKPSVEQLDPRVLPALSPAGAAGSLQGVVELQVTYRDGQVAVGTGVMIDSKHVLTAAHLLYSAQDGGYATSVEAVPAADGGLAPFGAAFGTYERVDPSWYRFDQTHPGMTSPAVEDVGLVTLNRPVGASTGWFTLGAGAAGGTFQTAGYLATKGLSGPHLFTETGTALDAGSGSLTFTQHSLALLPGQSGSPLWQASGGAPVLSGILTGTDGFSPSGHVYAVSITPALARELHRWETAQTGHSGKGLQHPAVTGSQLKGSVPTAVVAKAMDDYPDGGDSYDTSSGYDTVLPSSDYTYDPGIAGARTSALSDYGYNVWQTLQDQGYQHLGIINPYTGSYFYRWYDNSNNLAWAWWYNWPTSSVDWSWLNW